MTSDPPPRFSSAPLLATLLVLIGVGQAHAQLAPEPQATESPPDPRVRARTLFTEGVGQAAARRFAEAEATFREALGLHDAPSIRYNLASVLFELHRFPEAFALATAVASDASTPPSVVEANTGLLGQMQRVAGFLRLESTPVPGSELVIDGFQLPDPSVELPISAVDSHVVQVRLDGRELSSARITLQSGEHRFLFLPVVVETQVIEDTRPVAGSGPESGGGPVQERPLIEEWWFWASVGGGAVVVTILIGAVAASAGSGGVAGAPVVGNFEPGVLRW